MLDDGRSLDWVKLASYATGFEADQAVSALSERGIPAIVRNHAGTGLFGAGFQGTTPGGVEVHVPATAVDAAWRVVVKR